MSWDKKKDKFLLGLLAAYYSFLVVYYQPWKETWKMPDYAMMLIAVATLLGLAASCLFLVLGKKNWKGPFIVLNIVYFLFGCYVTHFAWTFWLFKEPTLMERITHTWVYFVLGVCLPVVNIVKSRR